MGWPTLRCKCMLMLSLKSCLHLSAGFCLCSEFSILWDQQPGIKIQTARPITPAANHLQPPQRVSPSPDAAGLARELEAEQVEVPWELGGVWSRGKWGDLGDKEICSETQSENGKSVIGFSEVWRPESGKKGGGQTTPGKLKIL